MIRKLVKTRDESYTLFVPELDEHYHSIHGAIQESLHIFIQAGLRYLAGKQKSISVLEVGFGTGLNAILSLIEAERQQLSLNYCGIEKYPLLEHEYSLLEYHQHIEHPKASEWFNGLHQTNWGTKQSLNPHFELTKLRADLKTFASSAEFDLIYFDAFAPSAQADLWTTEIFKKMYGALKPEGVLVTYCVKGIVKRAIQEVGFTVEKLPGPPGKREMLRAHKS